jgi:hypothetical protein
MIPMILMIMRKATRAGKITMKMISIVMKSISLVMKTISLIMKTILKNIKFFVMGQFFFFS